MKNVLIPYNTGEPPDTGVYACRVRDQLAPDLLEDIILMYMDGKWWYMRSDLQFRDAVLGWVGPLQRRMVRK